MWRHVPLGLVVYSLLVLVHASWSLSRRYQVFFNKSSPISQLSLFPPVMVKKKNYALRRVARFLAAAFLPSTRFSNAWSSSPCLRFSSRTCGGVQTQRRRGEKKIIMRNHQKKRKDRACECVKWRGAFWCVAYACACSTTYTHAHVLIIRAHAPNSLPRRHTHEK